MIKDQIDEQCRKSLNLMNTQLDIKINSFNDKLERMVVM